MESNPPTAAQHPPRRRVSRRQALAIVGGGAGALALRRVALAVPLWQDAEAGPSLGQPGPSPLPAPVSVSVPSPAARVSASPTFSDVSEVEPLEALRFLAGSHPRYPGANLESLMAFSPADILETMDTDVLDSVYRVRGWNALAALYALIARETLEALLTVYNDQPVALALDAGHGGKRGVYYDPGSQGTEADHTRQTVAAIEQAATDPRYATITVRRIFNDAIGDEFGMPPPEDRKSAASLTMRNVRASMLAYEADRWNEEYPDAPVAVHTVSVHFNAGSGGTLTLHQGNSVPAALRSRSVAFGVAFVASVRSALNATGLLPYTLRLALGTGLSDDRLLYEPPMRVTSRVNPYTGADRAAFPRLYAMLQTSLLQRDYAHGALIFNRLA